MPRGSKICASCNTSNGPRAFNCKSCGAAFSFKEKGSVQVKETVGKPDPVMISGDPIKKLVYVPSGTCPVQLNDLTPEGAVEWARKIRDMNPKVKYSTNALRYWMRGFVDPMVNEDLYDELSASISE